MNISILSTLALKGLLDRFKADFERSLAARLELRFDATQAILKLLESGSPQAQCDVLILTAEAMEELQKKGAVAKVQILGSSGVGVAGRGCRGGAATTRLR